MLLFQKEQIIRAKESIFLRNGSVAEWLGRALQKLLQRFESARNLERKPNRRKAVFFCGKGMRACPQIPEKPKKQTGRVRSVWHSFVPQNNRITETRGSATKVIRSEPQSLFSAKTATRRFFVYLLVDETRPKNGWNEALS
jgi:hypothetical protein